MTLSCHCCWLRIFQILVSCCSGDWSINPEGILTTSNREEILNRILEKKAIAVIRMADSDKLIQGIGSALLDKQAIQENHLEVLTERAQRMVVSIQATND